MRVKGRTYLMTGHGYCEMKNKSGDPRPVVNVLQKVYNKLRLPQPADQKE